MFSGPPLPLSLDKLVVTESGSTILCDISFFRPLHCTNTVPLYIDPLSRAIGQFHSFIRETEGQSKPDGHFIVLERGGVIGWSFC